MSYPNLTKPDKHSSESHNFTIILFVIAGLTNQTFSNIISSVVISMKSNDTSEITTTLLGAGQIRKVVETIEEVQKNDLIGCLKDIIADLKDAWKRTSCNKTKQQNRLVALRGSDKVMLSELWRNPVGARTIFDTHARVIMT